MGTRLWRRLVRAVVLVAGMSGVRLDRPAPQIAVTALLVAVTLTLQHAAAGAGFALEAAVAAGVLYYVGNTVLCLRTVSTALRARLGDATALRYHEVFLGVAFANQAAALGTLATHSAGTFHLAPAPLTITCAALTVVGLGTKVWATALTGLDVYYYRDLFLRRPVGDLVERGPYRWLRNPMYGLGNVQSYAPALAAGSAPGLVLALVFHVAIYAFHLALERPFVARLAAGRPTAASAAA